MLSSHFERFYRKLSFISAVLLFSFSPFQAGKMPAEAGWLPLPPPRQRQGWRPGHGLRRGAAKEPDRVQEWLVAGSGWQVLSIVTLVPKL